MGGVNPLDGMNCVLSDTLCVQVCCVYVLPLIKRYEIRTFVVTLRRTDNYEFVLADRDMHISPFLLKYVRCSAGMCMAIIM